ncbi:Chromo domain-like [Parasponia andersonii]|uniref:Chromo domain-like n=1 Tax=Parasponia andersonii TaxID=3476 RepID=A0A2P5BJB7_PARAD|nr:Chromo domain-like [Parasponia andersonii]
MGSSNTAITDSSASASASALASESDGSTSEAASDTTQNLNDDASCPFSEGEKVLASHGPFYYEAKVMRIMGYMNKWNFFVHYHVSFMCQPSYLKFSSSNYFCICVFAFHFLCFFFFGNIFFLKESMGWRLVLVVNFFVKYFSFICLVFIYFILSYG